MVTENTVNNLSAALRQLSDAFHRASVACKDLEYTIPLLAAGVDLPSDAPKQGAGPPEKRKRIKDPDEPRRPPSGYLLFLQKARQDLSKTDSDLKPAEVMSKMAAMWKDLDESQRKPYEEEAKQLKVEYDLEFEQYEKDHPEIQKKRRRNKPQPNPSASPSAETQQKPAAPTTTTPAKESKAQSKKDVSPKSERKTKEKEKEKEKEKDKDKDKKKRRKSEAKSKTS